MVRFDTSQQSTHGTWIDGYLPSIEKMKQLAQKYHHLDIDQQGLPLEYGFGQVSEIWKEEDIFGAIASAMRAAFDYKNLPPDVRPAPCCMWLMQTNREPANEKTLPLYQEYLAEPRKADYYHLITIHDECPIAEACLQQVVRNLGFRPKPETTYVDKESFVDAVSESLTHYVGMIATPWLEVEEQLDALSDNLISI
jgi:hypothetical protein